MRLGDPIPVGSRRMSALHAMKRESSAIACNRRRLAATKVSNFNRAASVEQPDQPGHPDSAVLVNYYQYPLTIGGTVTQPVA